MTDFAIEPMTLADIPQVFAIDQLSFANPWSERSYYYELTENHAAHFFVLVEPPRTIWGYAGLWLIVDEAHINTLAVHPTWRRRGYGESLLVALLHCALSLNALSATLEVRASNHAAQNLYRKYGFAEVGRRKRYYRDNGEDALLLTAQFTPDYAARYALYSA